MHDRAETRAGNAAHELEPDRGTMPADSAPDTLAEWLCGRFGHNWAALGADDRTYWRHEAEAVRRAVARGGFKPEPTDDEVKELRRRAFFVGNTNLVVPLYPRAPADDVRARAEAVANAALAHDLAHLACTQAEETFANTEDDSAEERAADERRIAAHEKCEKTHDALKLALGNWVAT